jgi:hypothetical protein
MKEGMVQGSSVKVTVVWMLPLLPLQEDTLQGPAEIQGTAEIQGVDSNRITLPSRLSLRIQISKIKPGARSNNFPAAFSDVL